MLDEQRLKARNHQHLSHECQSEAKDQAKDKKCDQIKVRIRSSSLWPGPDRLAELLEEGARGSMETVRAAL